MVYNAPKACSEKCNDRINRYITNKSTKEWTGYLSLEFLDRALMNVDGLMFNVFPYQYFTLEVNDSAKVKFPFTIPLSFNDKLYCKIKMFNPALIDSTEQRVNYKDDN